MSRQSARRLKITTATIFRGPDFSAAGPVCTAALLPIRRIAGVTSIKRLIDRIAAESMLARHG